MSTRAIIAVVLDDGRMLAAFVECDGGTMLAERLSDHYATAELAGDLLTLGDLTCVGPTIDTCIPEAAIEGRDGETVILGGSWDLECHKPTDVQHVHLFERGCWRHEADAWATDSGDEAE